jgi:hypothetical protein
MDVLEERAQGAAYLSLLSPQVWGGCGTLNHY